MLTEDQRRRVDSARMDPPIGARLAGTLMIILGSVTLAGGATPSRDSVILVLGVTIPGWVGVTSLTRGSWEPVVAFLGRLVEEGGRGAPASRAARVPGALDVLTWIERRDLVAARLRAAEGRREAWAFTGWLALGLGGFCVAIELWQLRESPPSAIVDFLVSVSIIVLGSFVAERARWRPIVAALREALGETDWASISERRESAARSGALPRAAARLSQAEQRAVTRAQREQPSRFVLPLSVMGVGFLLIYFTAREVGPPAWRPEWALAGCVAVVAAFESGYLLARGRWQRIVAIMMDGGGARSNTPGRGDEEGG
jgi:hypothetical protein